MEALKPGAALTTALKIECWDAHQRAESVLLFKRNQKFRARPRDETCLFEVCVTQKGYQFSQLSSDLSHDLDNQKHYSAQDLQNRVIEHLGRKWKFSTQFVPLIETTQNPAPNSKPNPEHKILLKSFGQSLGGLATIVLVAGLMHFIEERRKREEPEWVSPEVAKLIYKPVRKTEKATATAGGGGGAPKTAAEMKQSFQSQSVQAAFSQLTSKASLAKTLGNSNQFLANWKSKGGFKIQDSGTSGASSLAAEIGKISASASGGAAGRGIASVGGGATGYGTGAGSGTGSPISGQGTGRVTFETKLAKVEEGLTADEVGEVILRHAAEIRYCYEDALLRNPSTEGKLQLLFKISPRGKVTTTEVRSSSMNDTRLEDCVVRKLVTWNFPQPKGGIEVPVTYPFVFKNLDRGTQAKR
jgi:hypothetical protein